MQNILEDANIKLGSVVSDVFGKSGFAIICALANGYTDPEELSQLAKGSLVKKKAELQKASELLELDAESAIRQGTELALRL